MIAAVAPLLCIRYLPPEMLGTALGVIAATSSIGFAAGPAIGGILTQHLSWHWIFLVNIPIGILGILFAARVIPDDEPEDRTVSFDYPGAVTLFGAMVFGTFVLEEVAARGVTDPLILACGALCLLCSGAVHRPGTDDPGAVPEHPDLLEVAVHRGSRRIPAGECHLHGYPVPAPVLPHHGDALRSYDKRPVSPDSPSRLSPSSASRSGSGRTGAGPSGICGRRLRVCHSLQRHLCGHLPGDRDCPAARRPHPDGSCLRDRCRAGLKQDHRERPGRGGRHRVFADGDQPSTSAVCSGLRSMRRSSPSQPRMPAGLSRSPISSPATFLSGFHITMAAGLVLSAVPLVLSAIVPDKRRKLRDRWSRIFKG